MVHSEIFPAGSSSSSFLRRIIKVFVGNHNGIVVGQSGASGGRHNRVHPLEESSLSPTAAATTTATTATRPFALLPTTTLQRPLNERRRYMQEEVEELQTDESGSCEECDCSCEDNYHPVENNKIAGANTNMMNTMNTRIISNATTTSVTSHALPPQPPCPGPQSNAASRGQKKRSNSIVAPSYAIKSNSSRISDNYSSGNNNNISGGGSNGGGYGSSSSRNRNNSGGGVGDGGDGGIGGNDGNNSRQETRGNNQPGRASSVGGVSINYYHAASNSNINNISSCNDLAKQQRSSSNSMMAGGNIVHHDMMNGGSGSSNSTNPGNNIGSNHGNLGRGNDKHHRAVQVRATNSQVYRQHFTGHGPVTPPSITQQEAMTKRRLSFFKIAAMTGGARGVVGVSGGGGGGRAEVGAVSASSRRGSALSTKSQETAVNLTGINIADEFEDEADIEDDNDPENDNDNDNEGVDGDREMDVDEDGADSDAFHDNDPNDPNDPPYDDEDGRNDMIKQDYFMQDSHNIDSAMLTSDIELELYSRRQEEEGRKRLSSRARRFRYLRRQGLILTTRKSSSSSSSKTNNHQTMPEPVVYRTRSRAAVAGSNVQSTTVTLLPKYEQQQRPSPIQLPEILHLIFQYVVDLTPTDDYSQREIYSCLLVSKQWYLVAQKTLWREIRLKNPTKLSLFIDLLKRTDTVECLGIERNRIQSQIQSQSQSQSQSKRALPDDPLQTKNLFGSITANGQQRSKKQHPRTHHLSRANVNVQRRQQQKGEAIVMIDPQNSMILKGDDVGNEQSIMSLTLMQRRLHERANAVKKIVLHKLKLIEDSDILPLTSWFHHLQIIEFYICEKLTDKIIVAVAENCPQLQQLLIPGCSKITDLGISEIALHCPRMKHLDLRACSNVSDESLILVARNCRDLWHLNVGRVTAAGRVTGKSIVEIAKNTNLNTLGLAGCAMTDDAVIEIARSTRSGLHRISLNSCPMLTSASIRVLMQLCPNLAVLEIKQCLLVTDMATLYRFSTRRVLVELCPELQKRLIDYKVELAAMNVSIQSNNVASTTQLASSSTENSTQGHNASIPQPATTNATSTPTSTSMFTSHGPSAPQ
ncbi:Antagonist of MEN (Mitotic Exit Network) [Mortierella sp. GBA30]|nr:Antagonist of MEN (Mitotic Exit Network) [Mortierella sp. GBA30]